MRNLGEDLKSASDAPLNSNQNQAKYDYDSGRIDVNNIECPSGVARDNLVEYLKVMHSVPPLAHLAYFLDFEQYKLLIKRIIENKSLCDCRKLLAIYIKILSFSTKENNLTTNVSIMIQKLCTTLPTLTIA